MIDSPAARSFGLTSGLRAGLAILFILPALGCFAVGMSFAPPELIPMALGAAFLIACGVFWYLTGKMELLIDSEGIRRTSPFGSQDLWWDEIAEYRYQEIPVQYGGAAGGLVGALIQAAYEAKTGKRSRSLQLTLQSRDKDKKIKVTSNYKDAEEAIARIVNRLHEGMRAAARQDLEYGEVMFGALGLSRQGLSWNAREPIPWADITKIELSGRKLRVRRKGKMFDALAVSQVDIPDLLLALELMDTLRVNYQMAPVVRTFA